MNDDQRLSLLDRRAAAATAALDEAVQQVPVPEPSLGAPRRGFRRFLPLAVAAGLAVIALVGAALVFDDDEQSTVAEQPGGITRLALPDPEALGYRIAGAFDGSNVDANANLNITMTIHSPADGPRWHTPVVSYSLEANQTTLSGESVDVGGPEAVVTSSAGGRMIAWSEGDRVRFIGGPGYPTEELTDLVTRTIAEGVPDGAALPRYEVVHVAPYTDLYPMLIMSASFMAIDVAGIGYEATGGSDSDVIAVTTSRGSEDRWRASFALAVGTDRLTVRGREAVRADFGDGLTQVSWLEADGTLVRVEAFDQKIPVDVLEQLQPISDADFADLVDKYESGVEVVEHQLDEAGEEIEAPEPILPDGSTTTVVERTPLAEVGTSFSVGVEEFSLRATLLRAPDGSVEFETSSEGSMGGSSTGQGLADASTNVVVRNDVAPGGGGAEGELIAGVIGPSGGTVEFVDTATGEAFEPISTSGPSHANIPGSDHVLFLGTIAPEHRGRAITVVTTSAAGEEIRLSAPAQP